MNFQLKVIQFHIGNAFKNEISKMAAILSRPQCDMHVDVEYYLLLIMPEYADAPMISRALLYHSPVS